MGVGMYLLTQRSLQEKKKQQILKSFKKNREEEKEMNKKLRKKKEENKKKLKKKKKKGKKTCFIEHLKTIFILEFIFYQDQILILQETKRLPKMPGR